MPAECSPPAMQFARLDGRAVVADFGGGVMTSDAGALLLGATDRVIGLVDRFAACFSDGRAAGRVVHGCCHPGGPAGLWDRAGLRGT